MQFWDDHVDADALVLDELLLWIEDGPATSSAQIAQRNEPPADLASLLGAVPPPRDRRRSPKVSSSFCIPTQLTTVRLTHALYPQQRMIESLEHEVSDLTDELEQLRARRRQAAASEELRKRRRAEQDCVRLRDAVAIQARFLRGLRSVFSAPPSITTGLNIHQFLHKHTRLPLDRSLRALEYSALADEARLHKALELLCRETEALSIADDEPVVPSLTNPFIRTKLTSDRAGFQVESTCIYAVPTRDISAAVRGVWVAFRDSPVKCCGYKSTSMDGQIVDTDAMTVVPMNALYRVEDIHFKISQDSDVVEGEGRSVSFHKQTDEQAVLLWDFVDEDEMYPIQPAKDVTRKPVGSCLIRREICDDGVERAVCRAVITRRYQFHEAADKQALEQFTTVTGSFMQDCEEMIRHSVVDSIEVERAVYAKVVKTLGRDTAHVSGSG